MAGNGTIGLELLEDLPDLDAVVVPWGGGGLTCGIASALRALKPGVRIYSVEPETGAPMARSFAAGESLPVDDYRASFVDGSGSKALLPKMWELGRGPDRRRTRLDARRDRRRGAHARRARAGRRRGRRRARARRRRSRAAPAAGSVACIVSGGNIDAERLRSALAGETPA